MQLLPLDEDQWEEFFMVSVERCSDYINVMSSLPMLRGESGCRCVVLLSTVAQSSSSYHCAHMKNTL